MTAKILANITNNVVIQIAGRRFPGIVIQGDSLNSLYVLSEEIRALANDTQSEELKDLARELSELLAARLMIYENVLKEHGLDLPYHRT